MRRILTWSAFGLLACALVACDPSDAGVKAQQAGQTIQDTGTAFGLPQVALLGALVSGIGSIVAGKKAGVAQTYAHTPYTLDEAKEMGDLLVQLGYVPPKAKA